MTLDTIENIDCLQGMRQIPDNSVDMVLCDPPFGVTRAKWDSIIPPGPLWAEYSRVIKPNGAIVLFSKQPFATTLINNSTVRFRYELIWRKSQGTDFLNANRKPLAIHENILVFYAKQPTYNKQYLPGKPYSKTRRAAERKSLLYGQHGRDEVSAYPENRRNPVTVLDFPAERGLHPTQKPVALCEWLIKTYTNLGETVLDNCMGSGTTAVACINTGRRFIGFETDPDYYKSALDRIEHARLDADNL